MPKFNLQKNKIVSNLSQNSLENLLPNKRTSTPFPQPKKVNCFQCGKDFLVKFVISKQNFSQKNNWGFWTEDEKYKNQEWCSSCLRQIFYDKENYWQAVQSSKKRALFRVYLARDDI